MGHSHGNRLSVILLAAFLLVVTAGCGAPSPTAEPEAEADGTPSEGSSAAPSGQPDPAPEGTVTLYTSVTQDTVDAVVAALREEQPGITVEVFRAPTGELNARLATEQQAGGIQADVIWHTDPLSMYAHDAGDLLLEWTPEGAEAVAPEYRTETFWGARILNLVIVHQQGLQAAPTGWSDLTGEAYRDGVALPDPSFAGSAYAALGYFALAPEYGIDYYGSLKANGTVQLRSIDDVITGVAEGRFQAGIALDKSVQDAIDAGSPIEIVWPDDPGAIALYSPIAVFASTANEPAAQAFTEFVLAPRGQRAIAGTGWQPVLPDVEGPAPPEGAEQVSPDWEDAFGRQEELLTEYRTIFGA